MRATRGRIQFVVSLVVTLALVTTASPTAASSHIEVVQTFPGGSVEGVAVDKTGNVFASSTFTGELLKFEPGSSDFEVFGSIDDWAPGGPFGAGFLGLAVDSEGNVYGTAQWADSTGVYKFDRKTGDATRIPGTEVISFPNSIAFDKRGNMYVTDSNSNGLTNPLGPTDVPLGAIWRVDRNGSVEKWAEDPQLGGNGIAALSTPVGANGIAYRQGELIVANTEGFGLFTVPILKSGDAGPVSPLSIPGWPLFDSPFGPIPAVPDGIALDVHGAIYVAVVAQNAVIRVNSDGTVDTLFQDPTLQILDTPSSVAFGTGSGFKETLYVVNLAFGPPGSIGGALIAIDVGVPGMPLP